MTSRELIVLGTSSQAPTRLRNQSGAALRWDQELVLFDPGEGFQRQCLFGGVSIAKADALLLSHFHGDHCLGLPGLVHRRMMEAGDRPLPTWFPAGGRAQFEALTNATATIDAQALDPRPIDGDGVVGRVGDLVVTAAGLSHPVPTVGYRLDSPAVELLDVERLAAMGVRGPALGELEYRGSVEVGGRTVNRADVLRRRPGKSVAYLLDTAVCDAALRLAADVDLLVCEATFLEADRRIAEATGHMTARDVGWLARTAGAARVVLTHFSARYDDPEAFGDEAGDLHPDVIIARDFDRIPVPSRDDEPPEEPLSARPSPQGS